MADASDRARRLISSWPRSRTLDERRETLASLGKLYDDVVDVDPATARDVRVAFVRALRDDTDLATDEHLLHFLHGHIEPEDFDALRWDDADHVIAFCEQLYSIQLDTPKAAERIEYLVGQLLRQVLQEYEKRQRHESMFKLVRFAPSLTTFTDAELFRLRHRAYLYEMRRVRRNRLVLYGYLAMQALFVIVLFPVLFVYAENGAIQGRLERATGADRDGHERDGEGPPIGPDDVPELQSHTALRLDQCLRGECYVSKVHSGTTGDNGHNPSRGVGTPCAGIRGRSIPPCGLLRTTALPQAVVR